MHILFVSPRQSWPAVSGAKLRDYHLARGLGIRAELTYVYFADPAIQPPSAADLAFCSRVVAVPQPRMYTPAKLVQGIFGSWPLPLVNYSSPEMASVLSGLLQDRSFDLVHLDSIHLLPYERLFRDHSIPVVYDWHNIESEAMSRYGETVGSLARRTYAGLTARKLASAEREILRRTFGHIVCSRRELELLRAMNGSARVTVVENGVDLRLLQDREPDTGARRRIVFVGSMSYHANVDAACWFAGSVWPRIRERYPQWVLTLVGSNPTPAVLALQAQPGVEVTGTVPDVKPYYRQAVAAIVPLRTGGGTRLKILEAMAASVPVISTEIGAEGLPVHEGSDILLAREEQDWVTALSAVAADTEGRRSLVDNARGLAAEFDWDRLGQLLHETYFAWLVDAQATSSAVRRE